MQPSVLARGGPRQLRRRGREERGAVSPGRPPIAGTQAVENRRVPPDALVRAPPSLLHSSPNPHTIEVPMQLRPLTQALLAALLVLAGSSHAQNCAQTSVGLTPLPVLGAGDYQGFQGGLYPGGANDRPLAHKVTGLAQATAVVPRDAAGAPDPNGKIVFLSVGMSNCTQEFSRFVQLANADPSKHPRVVLVD